MSIESVMPSNHLILCCPLLLLPSIFPSIRVFPSESALGIRWPKDWSFSFSFSISPFSPSEWTGWISLQPKGLSRLFSSTTVQNHQFFGAQPSLWSNSHIQPDYWRNHGFDRYVGENLVMVGPLIVGHMQACIELPEKSLVWHFLSLFDWRHPSPPILPKDNLKSDHFGKWA